jgi:hypothetical protein
MSIATELKKLLDVLVWLIVPGVTILLASFAAVSIYAARQRRGKDHA